MGYLILSLSLLEKYLQSGMSDISRVTKDHSLKLLRLYPSNTNWGEDNMKMIDNFIIDITPHVLSNITNTSVIFT